MENIPFNSRNEAGIQLARLLLDHQNNDYSIILCLSPAAIPVAVATANELNLELDILFSKDFLTPGSPLASGAVTSSGETCFNADRNLLESDQSKILRNTIDLKQKCLERSEKRYRNGRRKPFLRNRNIIIVGDGSQRTSAIMATIQAARKASPRSITVAFPMMDIDTLDSVRISADRVVCLIVTKYHPYLFEIYPSENTSDIFRAQQLIANFWKTHQTKAPRAIRENIRENALYVHHSEIEKCDWRDFTSTFSEQYTGWRVSIRIMRFLKDSKRYTNRFFLSRTIVTRSPFIGMAYIESQNVFCVRHITNEKIALEEILFPVRLTFRDSSNDRKSLRIDTKDGDSFYIQVIQERKSSSLDRQAGWRTIEEPSLSPTMEC